MYLIASISVIYLTVLILIYNVKLLVIYLTRSMAHLSCNWLHGFSVMYLTVLIFYTQYIVTSHVFDLIHATTVMYLTVFLSFLNISHVFDCCKFTDRNVFVSSYSCVSIFSHVFDCIEYGSVKYLTIFSLYVPMIYVMYLTVFNWSWYK